MYSYLGGVPPYVGNMQSESIGGLSYVWCIAIHWLTICHFQQCFEIQSVIQSSDEYSFNMLTGFVIIMLQAWATQQRQ